MCPRTRAPRAFYRPIKALLYVARAWNWLSASPSEFEVISGICSHLRDVSCEENPVIETCAIGKRKTAKNITGVIISNNTYITSFTEVWGSILPSSESE